MGTSPRGQEIAILFWSRRPRVDGGEPCPAYPCRSTCSTVCRVSAERRVPSGTSGAPRPPRGADIPAAGPHRSFSGQCARWRTWRSPCSSAVPQQQHKASRQSTDARCRARCAPTCEAIHLFPHWERRTPPNQTSGLGPCRRSRTTDRWIRAEIMTWGSNQYSFRAPGFSFCDFEPHQHSTSPQTR